MSRLFDPQHFQLNRHEFFPVAMPLNSSGMYRGVIRKDGTPRVALFGDEEVE